MAGCVIKCYSSRLSGLVTECKLATCMCPMRVLQWQKSYSLGDLKPGSDCSHLHEWPPRRSAYNKPLVESTSSAVKSRSGRVDKLSGGLVICGTPTIGLCTTHPEADNHSHFPYHFVPVSVKHPAVPPPSDRPPRATWPHIAGIQPAWTLRDSSLVPRRDVHPIAALPPGHYTTLLGRKRELPLCTSYIPSHPHRVTVPTAEANMCT